MGYITTPQYSTKKAVSRKAHCCCLNACMRSTIEVIHLHELLLHIQPWRFLFTGSDLIYFAKLVHFLCSSLESQKAMVEFLKLLFLTIQNVHIQDTSVQSYPRIPCGTDWVFVFLAWRNGIHDETYLWTAYWSRLAVSPCCHSLC